jgi:membrane associated rhomboid family serine protease
MGYEDRDYFRSKPRFGLSPGMGTATKGLIIVVAAGYLIGLVVANTVSFTDREFWAVASNPETQQYWARMIFVLTAADVAPWVQGYAPGYWKVLASWAVAPGIITAAVDAIMVYIAGKAVEELLGTRRFLYLFIGACLAANLLAGFADPLMLPSRQVVIMGAGPGVMACLATLIWIAPNQPSIFNWPLKRVVLIILVAVIGFNLIFPLFGGEIAQSPTQLLWGAGAGAWYMWFLKTRNMMPKLAVESYEEPWSKRGYLNEYSDDDPAAQKQRDRERKETEKREAEQVKRAAAAQAEQAKLDAILEKISKQGINALSRAERKFLEGQSKRKK